MAIEVVSNSDSKEAVQAANAVLADAKTDAETKSASSSDKTEEQDENAEESETSENETEESESEESESENDEENKDKQKPKKKGGFQKRIARFQRELSEKDRKIAFLEELAMKGKTAEKANPENVTTQKTESVGKPKADNYETHEEYVEALTDWKLEQREKERESKSKVDQMKTEQQKRMDTHNSRINDFKKQQPDYDDVIGEFLEEMGDVNFSVALDELVTTSDYGPAVIYELVKNPKEFERINSLGVVAAAKEFARIEDRVSKSSESKKETKQKTTTSAPPPIKSVGSGGSGKVKSLSDPNLSQAEYEQIRMEQRAKRAWGS